MKDAELDALIAEKVMGFEKSETPRGFPRQWKIPSKNPDSKHRKEYPWWYTAFQPSTDIADAFHVVEKLGGKFSMDTQGGICFARFFLPNGEVPAEATTEGISRAICLAALKAVGVEVP